MLSAKAVAIVDLPSLGMADVIPITLLAATTPFKSAASFIVRMASEKRENGASTTVEAMPTSLGIRPVLGDVILGVRGLAALFSGFLCKGTNAIHPRPSIDSI